jgi:hypothetical protein
MASGKEKKQYSNIDTEKDIEMYDVKSARESDLNQSNDYEIAQSDRSVPDDSKFDEDRSGVDTETLDDSIDEVNSPTKGKQTSDSWQKKNDFIAECI